MDTKSKNTEHASRGIGTFLLLFFALNLLLVALVGDLFLLVELESWRDTPYQTNRMQRSVAAAFSNAMELGVQAGEVTIGQSYVAPEQVRGLLSSLNSERVNLRYFAENRAAGAVFTNTDCRTAEEFQDRYIRQNDEADNYLSIWFDQNGLNGQLDTLGPEQSEPLQNMLYLSSAYTGLEETNGGSYQFYARPGTVQELPDSAPASEYYNTVLSREEDPFSDVTAMISVPYYLQEVGSSALWSGYQRWYYGRFGLFALSALAGFCLLLLLVVALRHRYLSCFNRFVGRLVSNVWLEWKLCYLLGVGALGISSVIELDYGTLAGVIGLICTGWLLYFFLCDLAYNGKRFFTHNMLAAARRWVKEALAARELHLELQKRLRRRFLLFTVAEGLLVMLALLFAVAGGEGLLYSLLILIPGVWLYLRYLKQYTRILCSWEEIITQSARMKNGDYSHPLQLDSQDDLYYLANNLNDIQNGIQTAVENRVKSERMKVELITNVSHDLKTPLTSIINYVDLLSKESLQPEFANDYVRILERKAQSLKALVQDLFEISKANSGNMELHLEQLDLTELLDQTVAELEERLAEAGLEMRTTRPDERLMVLGDGKKLHRVFENLVVNAVKYSLPGTRIYLEISRTGEMAQVSMKNIANYEMTFTGAEILERFVRGDASRTTEGCGLGLSIAQSFVSAMGGQLSAVVDGDLFKVQVTLPLSRAGQDTELSEEEKQEEGQF